MVNIAENREVEQFIGMHISRTGYDRLSKKLKATVKVYPELDAIQIFTHGPQTYEETTFDPDLKRTAKKLGVNIHVHGSYMCLPWNGKTNTFNHTINNFRVAHRYGAESVVLHMPKDTVENIVNGIKPLVTQLRKEKLSPVVMLEMKSLRSHPTQSMERPEQINLLTKMLFEEKMDDCVRICIDTAHIDAGNANIKTYKQGKKYISDLDDRLIGLIHLNGNGYDSSKRAGDKHEVPLSTPDFIWGSMKYTKTGCKAFIDFAMVKGIDVILEIHDNHSVNSIRQFIDKIE